MTRGPLPRSDAVEPRGIKNVVASARTFPRLESAALNNARDTRHESESARVDLETTAGLAAGAETFMASLKIRIIVCWQKEKVTLKQGC